MIRPVAASHSVNVSKPADSTRVPSAENAAGTPAGVFLPRLPSTRVCTSRPLAASHTFDVLSQLPDSSRLPSGENETDHTKSECPSKVRISWPVAASHILRVLSPLPDRTRVPSRENTADQTEPECPSKVRMSCPVAVSQSFSVLSKLADNTLAPSGENATDQIGLACP